MKRKNVDKRGKKIVSGIHAFHKMDWIEEYGVLLYDTKRKDWIFKNNKSIDHLAVYECTETERIFKNYDVSIDWRYRVDTSEPL